MKYFQFVFLILITFRVDAQKVNRFSLRANYGLQGNFFFNGYEELGRPDGTAFLKKNFIGSIGGLDLSYRLTKLASINVGYSKSINSKRINYFTRINGVDIYISDFEIKHENRFYQLWYQRSLSKKNNHFNFELGVYYVRTQQQEISIGNYVAFEQRNFKNSYLEEGGFSAGLHYKVKIDTHFDLGVQSRIYYTVSADELELISLAPTLSYRF